MDKLVVSNIAWTNEEEQEVAESLQSLGINKVEIAPTKIWQDPTKATKEEIDDYLKFWANYSIEVIAFQSMLFARPDLKLFESEANRAECLRYLQDFIILAGQMGAKKMVFGSPKNRQRGEMSYDDAFSIAKDFFTEIAKTAKENNVVFCLEPNAPQYNCDFVTNAKEGADLVQAIGHPGFGLHLDTACMALAGDDIPTTIREYHELIQYFHISSPMLDQVEVRKDVNHAGAAEALRDVGYDKVISIEMRPDEAGTNVERIKNAITFVQATYSV